MKTQDLWNFTTTWQQAQFEDIFECQHTKNSSWKEGTLLVLKADRNLFSHMILVAEIRKVNMKDVLAHPTHWAHCHEHWQMLMGPYEKQTRLHLSARLHLCLLQNTYQLHLLPSSMRWAVMSLVQKLNGNNKTFAPPDFHQSCWKIESSCSQHCPIL